ncbi:hypothetical protein GCM10009809_10850 [Isoptericola hypogeus]|uniref:Uncharacterized protein n=1 Tax=Isoptericola hypogeus TaxID=300179 RepID=A0ABN2J2H5_9MICO
MSQARTGGNGRPGTGSPRPSPEVIRRRRIVVGSLAGALVLLVVLVTALVWPGFAQPEPQPTATVTAPPPTPTIEPSGRPADQTAFLMAQPDTVLQLALRGAAPYDAWVDDAGAVEAWELTYADGDGADAAKVQVLAGQWEDDDAAAGAYEALVKAAGDPTDEGEVTVGDQATGAYVVTPGSAAGTAVVTWRNGTAVLQATGPADLVDDVYSAYPL